VTSPLESVREANRILAGLVTHQHDDAAVSISIAALIRDEEPEFDRLAEAIQALDRGNGSRLQLACVAFIAGVLYERDHA
jgi:hypothetical protein